jgi:ABC-type branched-subunit amino acid transport system ATPase component
MEHGQMVENFSAKELSSNTKMLNEYLGVWFFLQMETT